MTSEAWHCRSADEALAHFGSSAAGLSPADASARLAANGPNQLTEGTRIAPLKIILGAVQAAIVAPTGIRDVCLAVAQRINRECQ